MKYLVISRSNGRDTSVASLSPRCITADPKRALEEARKIWDSRDEPFLSDVLIFGLEDEKVYEMQDSWGTEENPSKTIVCVVWKNYRPDQIVVRFFQDFAELCGVQAD